MKTANLLALAILATVPVCCRTVAEAPAPEAKATSPQAMLDAMDRRQPVPLLPRMADHQKQNMRDHLLAVQEIITAIGTKDFAAVGASARRIGSSEQMGAMCHHMGAAAHGFTELALEFHRTADKIGAAAKARDSDAVLAALSDTLAACTGCHQTFKQHVVDEAAFAPSTKTPAAVD